MKKITLVLVLLLAFGFAAVAEHTTEILFTGTLDFEIGADTQEDTPNLPVLSYGKAATAGLELHSADEKVSASIELDLLAVPKITAKTEINENTGPLAGDYSYDDFSGVDDTVVAYQNWESVVSEVDFFNTVVEWVDDEDDDVDIFVKVTEQTAFLALINAYPVNISAALAEVNSDEDIELLLDPGALSDDPEADEFELDNAAAADLATMVTALATYLDGMLDRAIDILTNNADTAAVQAINDRASLEAYILALSAEDVDALTPQDDEQITEAVDYLSDFEEEQGLYTTADTTVTVTAPAFIKKASFKLMGIGGVVDLTGNLTDTNLKVGMISLDRKGHFDETDADDAIGSYPSITAGLSSGVVDGLTADLTFYTDDNDVADQVDEVADIWYTWIYDYAAEEPPVDPKLGLKADLGYSMAIGDMTIGADASVGLYDMASADDSAFGSSIMPSFSGFGAKVDLQFDNGLGMTYIGADASYTIMGIVPSISFAMVTNTADDVIAWVEDDEYTSGLAAVKDAGGMAIGGGLKVDVGQFIGMTASVDGGATYAMPTDSDAILAWNAGLSVTPIEMLTISGGVADAGVWHGTAGSYLGWNADVALALAPFTIKGGVNQKFIAVDDEDPATAGQVFGWSGSIAYTHSIATITAKVGSAWDVVDEVAYANWSVMTKIKF